MRTFLLLILLFLANPAWAFQCLEKSEKQHYEEAERAFLIYVTGTKLDEELYKTLIKGYPAENDTSESIKAIFADYKVIEEFKGDPNYQPVLVDFLGIGMGSVGLTPGKYYLVMLEPPSKDEPSNIRAVNICNTPFGHYRLKAEPFQRQLDGVRALRDEVK